MKWARLAESVFIVVAAVSVYSFVTAAKDGELRRVCTPICSLRPDYAAQNRLAPDFELPSLDGKLVRLSDFRGKAVILDFWTKTCPPCLQEMPALAELAELLKHNPNTVFLTISTDETAADARDTLRSVLSHDAPFVTLLDPEKTVVTGKYGTRLYPETWFIDSDGVIRARFDGTRDWTNPLVLDLAKNLVGDLDCGVEFEAQQPKAGLLGICDDIPKLAK